MSQAQALEILKDGIATAKAGDKPAGREMIRQSLALDPRSEAAWLWLAGLAESPHEALDCLERVLGINPANERARTAIKPARVQAGVAAARAKDVTGARSLLQAAVTEDPTNEMALMWLATVAEGPRQSVALLERVLELNPANDRARTGLERYRSQIVVEAPPVEPHVEAEADNSTEAETDNATEAMWSCPLCLGASQDESSRCGHCGAWLTLDNPDVFFQPEDVEPEVFDAAIERLEAEDSAEDFETSYFLGIAYLNCRQYDAGIARLTAAVRLRPHDRELRAAVEAVGHLKASLDSAVRETARVQVRKTILVVDDSPTIRKLVSMTVERRGYQARVASDGNEAIDVIRDRGVPDLILLDINMPGLDGYQLCKLLRQNADTSEVPIVMLSGKDGFFSKVRGRMAGSTAYITKPFDPDGLLRVVERYCALDGVAVAAARD